MCRPSAQAIHGACTPLPRMRAKTNPSSVGSADVFHVSGGCGWSAYVSMIPNAVPATVERPVPRRIAIVGIRTLTVCTGVAAIVGAGFAVAGTPGLVERATRRRVQSEPGRANRTSGGAPRQRLSNRKRPSRKRPVESYAAAALHRIATRQGAARADSRQDRVRERKVAHVAASARRLRESARADRRVRCAQRDGCTCGIARAGLTVAFSANANAQTALMARRIGSGPVSCQCGPVPCQRGPVPCQRGWLAQGGSDPALSALDRLDVERLSDARARHAAHRDVGRAAAHLGAHAAARGGACCTHAVCDTRCGCATRITQRASCAKLRAPCKPCGMQRQRSHSRHSHAARARREARVAHCDVQRRLAVVDPCRPSSGAKRRSAASPVPAKRL